MRAAVMRKDHLVVDEVPEPEPGPGQVLVETLACGICGSDLHFLQHAERLAAMPVEGTAEQRFDPARDLVMGHEFCAKVVGLGTGVTNLQAGDVVVSIPAIVSGEGFTTVGYSHDYPGGYGERMVLMAPICIKVPDGLDPDLAALTEPMAVGLHAVAKSAIQPGEAAVVLGCGPVGLAAIAALRLAGIEPIVAADFSPARREHALKLGAHQAVDPKVEPAVEAWQRIDGAKPLVIFEAVGVPGMLDQAMRAAPRSATRSARILVVGVCMEDDTIWPLMGINKELTIQFALGYTPDEFSRTLGYIADGTLDIAHLITDRVGIAGVPGAFEALANPDDHVKILVKPALG
ncbi:MAG: zinc-binding dehydrogenase [Dehalococcoidia bacterium]